MKENSSMNETVVMILNEYLGIGPGCPGKFDGKYLLIGALKMLLRLHMKLEQSL